MAMCSHLPPRVRGVAARECSMRTDRRNARWSPLSPRWIIGSPSESRSPESVQRCSIRDCVRCRGPGSVSCTSAGPGLRWAMPEIPPAPPARSSQHQVDAAVIGPVIWFTAARMTRSDSSDAPTVR